MTCRIAAFYKFFAFPDFAARRAGLAQALGAAGVKGSLLIAPEGLNGTLAGSAAGIGEALEILRQLRGAETLTAKFSDADTQPFQRLKVRLKREIVSMGVPQTDPNTLVGSYVAPADWNQLIADPDTIVIDTRNVYETAIGTFPGALDPGTERFGEFPAWFRALRARLEAEGRTPRIAMFCTGGIRCEKATSFVKAEGFSEVYHLEGGILNYLEKIPAAENRWQGECFVFDARVSVGADLLPGTHLLCHACGHAVSPAAVRDAAFVPGVSCPACTEKLSDDQRARFAERQRQIDLAAARASKQAARKAQTAPPRQSRVPVEPE
jgi:UPF0176 protein